MSAHILVVEDETDLAAIVADYIDAAGFRTVVVGDGASALAHIRRSPPALVVLDLMLPVGDGLSVCRELRSFSDVPVIMITAKVEEIDRLLGLDSGADDYLCKPFSPRELVARIKAIMRRMPSPAQPPPVAHIDEARRTISVRARPLTLTPTEYALLAAMIRRPGVIFSRAQLLDLARRDEWDVTDRAIDTHVKNLRRKVAAIAPDLDFIQSVYGVGYRVGC
ncbi:response regulator [Dokdonella sp.]|uniref:response regulator n=1 Tax=Dokdonella sp. TaxID=2291710 RepID=UPI002F418141